MSLIQVYHLVFALIDDDVFGSMGYLLAAAVVILLILVPGAVNQMFGLINDER